VELRRSASGLGAQKSVNRLKIRFGPKSGGPHFGATR
jgi:hypothetical protein